MTNDQLTNLLNKIQAEVTGLLAVYLFGSSAAESPCPGSDIDLSLLASQPLSPLDCWNLSQALAVLAGRDVDLVDLRTASTVMRAQIVAHGRRIYCADEQLCTEFEDYVYSAYARLNEERREILEDIERRGTVYG